MKHLRYPVVLTLVSFLEHGRELDWPTCEHRDGVDVMKKTVMFAFEAGPQICDKNLCSLVQPNSGVFEAVSVVETGEIID